MKLPIIFTAVLANLPVGFYQPARYWDDRSPCPALNTLANHGYIPRNGRGITAQVLTKALKDVYNIGEDIPAFLIGETFKMGLNETATTISLKSISAHSNPQKFIEHDASLVRTDFALAGTTTQIDPKMVAKMITYATNRRSLSYDELIRYRKDRTAEAKATNPAIDFGARPQFMASAETALLFYVLKVNDRLPINYIQAFLWDERLPLGYTKPNVSLNLPTLLGNVC